MIDSNGVLHLDVSIQTDNYIDIEIAGEKDPRLPYYEGAYEVDPRKVLQRLETANMSMREDVIVNEIFYSEVENLSGGNTAYIGME